MTLFFVLARQRPPLPDRLLRLLVSAPSMAEAEKKVKGYLGPDWRAAHLRPVCETDMTVFMELV